MAVLGLLLLLSAAGLTVDVVLQNTSSISVNAVGQVFTLSPGWLFVAGVLVGAVGLLGVTLLLGGMARARRRRLALSESRGNAQDLQADRDRLAAELEHERAGRMSATPHSLHPSATRTRDNGRATVDPASEDRRGGPTPTEDAATDGAIADANGREPVAAGRHGIFHRRDH